MIAVLIASFSCNKEVSVSPEESAPPKGFIYLESIPTNARIFIDGVNTGKITPDSIKWLKSGTYKILLRKEFWADKSVYITVDEASKQYIKVDMSLSPEVLGSIYCNSLPKGADIFLNDSSINQVTPFEIKNLLPGAYEIRCRKIKYIDDSVIVNVRSQKIVEANLVLTDTIGLVVLNKDNSDLPTNSILSIAIDQQDRKWIGTDGKGLVLFDDRKFTIYNKDNSVLPDNRISALYVDGENTVWIGTTNGGLAKIKNNIPSIENPPGGQYYITAITSDLKGNIWVGTYNTGIFVYNGSTWEHYSKWNSNLTSDYITAIAIDANDNKWIGTNKGICFFNGTSWMTYNKANSNLADNVTSLAVDNKNILYAGFQLKIGEVAGGTMAKFNGKSWYFYKTIPEVTTIKIDGRNLIWVGTFTMGVGLIDPLFVFKVNYRTNNSNLPDNYVTSIAADSKFIRWIGTVSGGLVKLKRNP